MKNYEQVASTPERGGSARPEDRPEILTYVELTVVDALPKVLL